MKVAQNFNELYHQLMTRKVSFLATFFAVVFVTYLVLYVIDFIPEAPSIVPATEEKSEETIEETSPAPEVVPVAALPEKIIFDSLNKEVVVLNPASRAIADLDAGLLKGVVRHPDSADFTEPGNIFILGHSSYLPNVINKNFQAFNGIQNLSWGDKIRVMSADTEYVYRVEKVYKAKASDVVVPSTPGKARLTLATCNSFGSKDDRFVVEAVLSSQTAL